MNHRARPWPYIVTDNDVEYWIEVKIKKVRWHGHSQVGNIFIPIAPEFGIIEQLVAIGTKLAPAPQ